MVLLVCRFRTRWPHFEMMKGVWSEYYVSYQRLRAGVTQLKVEVSELNAPPTTVKIIALQKDIVKVCKRSCDSHVTMVWWSCDSHNHVTVMWQSWSCGSHVKIMWYHCNSHMAGWTECECPHFHSRTFYVKVKSVLGLWMWLVRNCLPSQIKWRHHLWTQACCQRKLKNWCRKSNNWQKLLEQSKPPSLPACS